MNQAARDVLIQAALEGHLQVRGMLHSAEGGECAQGVLHLLMHTTREEAVRCYASPAWLACFKALGIQFDLEKRFPCPICQYPHLVGLAHLNDVHGLDFLTIAHKVPVSDEPGVGPVTTHSEG